MPIEISLNPQATTLNQLIFALTNDRSREEVSGEETLSRLIGQGLNFRYRMTEVTTYDSLFREMADQLRDFIYELLGDLGTVVSQEWEERLQTDVDGLIPTYNHSLAEVLASQIGLADDDTGTAYESQDFDLFAYLTYNIYSRLHEDYEWKYAKANQIVLEIEDHLRDYIQAESRAEAESYRGSPAEIEADSIDTLLLAEVDQHLVDYWPLSNYTGSEEQTTDWDATFRSTENGVTTQQLITTMRSQLTDIIFAAIQEMSYQPIQWIDPVEHMAHGENVAQSIGGEPSERLIDVVRAGGTRTVTDDDLEDIFAELESLGVDLTTTRGDDDDDENLSGPSANQDTLGWLALGGAVLWAAFRRQ